MSIPRYVRIGLFTIVCVAAGTSGLSVRAADAPNVEWALSRFRPIQRDVEYETPPADALKKCRISVERNGKASGWVIYGPEGQILRRFADADGDGTVDQWRYYNHGLEVYRDIDTNKNTKPDQYRWLNTGGSRWAIDTNEDGRIDSWKSLSPEETVRQAVLALIRGDEDSLRTVLVTREELQSIGVADAYIAKIMDALSDYSRKMRELRNRSKVLSPATVWMRTDNATPCAIAAEEGKVKDDLVVYENTMAIVETAGKPGLVEVGELVRVGDVWKLTQIPQPLEGNTNQIVAGGALMQPTLPGAGAMGGPSPEIQRLLTDLQKLDQASPPPSAGPATLTEYNSKRVAILDSLVNASKSDDERNQWLRQMVDSIASAIQMGSYAEGVDRLKRIEGELRLASPKSPIVPYVTWRRILSDYTSQHQAANNAKQQELQKSWRSELETFAKDFPNADDTPEVLLQLAIAHEFVGKLVEAKRWYAELADRWPASKAGRKAVGALRRLDLKGKPLQFGGPSLSGGSINSADYAGKVVLIVYWATWCNSCTADLPVLQSLYQQYHGKGLEIIGVGMDVKPDPIALFLQAHKVTWPQIYQPGGVDSPPAMALGVIVPPVMILADRQGKVTTVTSGPEELKTLIPELVGEK
jgi:thiol-disulfide isomerase/thioredoxin